MPIQKHQLPSIHGIHEKAWLGFFTLEGVAALCAEFAVRIVDSGVLLLRWAFDVLRSAFRRGTGILPMFFMGRTVP